MDNSASSTHRRIQHSTTLNRKYVKKPTKTPTINSIAKRQADDLKRRQALAEKINRERLSAMKARKNATTAKAAANKTEPIAPPAQNPIVVSAKQKMFAQQSSYNSQQLSARELKNNAVESALKSVATMESRTNENNMIISPISGRKSFGLGKVFLALGCATLAVATIGYFVSLNMPDVSVRVAAMQTGIEASYPSYIPRGYSLKDLVSEDKKVIMTFSNGEASFKLTEEKSTWNSEALETNYVKETWKSNYTSIREQGLTIFISGSNAAWVNGGILYKIDTTAKNLTKKQIKSIATSF